MTEVTALWLPILLSSVFVFIASSIIHMAPLWHKNDYRTVKDEDGVMDALRSFDIPPGEYMLPRAKDMAESKTPEFAEKMNKGPVVMMKVIPSGPFSIGKNLVTWFLYLIIVGIFTAYVSGLALPPGANYLEVYRIAGVTSFIAYALALWQLTIWGSRSFSLNLKSTVDAIIYSLLTAGTFGWLWVG